MYNSLNNEDFQLSRNRTKSKTATSLIYFVFIIFGLVFLIVPIVIVYNGYQDLKVNQDLYRDAKTTNAEITGYSIEYSEDDSSGSYSFQYEFLNEYTGEFVTGRTSQKFSGSTASKIIASGKIEIKYLENGISIETMALSKSRFFKNNLLILGLAGGLGVLFAAIGFILFITNIRKNRLLKGKVPTREFIATYVNFTESMRVNGESFYRIQYTYTDDNGILVTDESAESYSYHEAMCYQNMKNFKIKTDGKMSAIIEDPRVIDLNNQNNVNYSDQNFNNDLSSQNNSNGTSINYSQLGNTQSYNYSGTKFCTNCGAEINRNDIVCPYCNNKQDSNN